MNQQPDLKNLPIEKLIRGLYQPRRQFDPQALQELADSIQSAGLIQPIVVRPSFGNQYEILAGERRWRAAQLAGCQTVPCLIQEISDEQAAAVSTIENIQREDLNPIEEANAYMRLIDEFHYQHEAVAEIVGKSRSKITNSLRLLKLNKSIQDWLIEKKLSEGHGKLLASLPTHAQTQFAEKCIQEDWSVRQLENALKQTRTNSIPNSEDPNLRHFEDTISQQFGAKVKLDADPNQKSGWLKIRYFDNDTLEGLLDKMGIKYD